MRPASGFSYYSAKLAIANDLNRNIGASVTMTAPTDEAFRTLIATAVDGIIVIDIEGRILVYNAACERLFGYSLEEVAGKNVKTLMPSPYREKHDGYLSRHRLTGHKGIIGIGREVVGCRKDGTTFPLYLSVGEGSSDGNPIYVGIIHDLTERKRWEAALIEREAGLKSMLDAGLGTSPTSVDEQKQADRSLRLMAEVGGLLANTIAGTEQLYNCVSGSIRLASAGRALDEQITVIKGQNGIRDGIG